MTPGTGVDDYKQCGAIESIIGHVGDVRFSNKTMTDQRTSAHAEQQQDNCSPESTGWWWRRLMSMLRMMKSFWRICAYSLTCFATQKKNESSLISTSRKKKLVPSKFLLTSHRIDLDAQPPQTSKESRPFWPQRTRTPRRVWNMCVFMPDGVWVCPYAYVPHYLALLWLQSPLGFSFFFVSGGAGAPRLTAGVPYSVSCKKTTK